MTFRIKNPYEPKNLTAFKKSLLLTLRNRIYSYKMTTNEILLNRYCWNTYKRSLREMCLLIVFGSKFYEDFDNEVIVKITNKHLDELARLITYGNGKIQGSGILQYAFKSK